MQVVVSDYLCRQFYSLGWANKIGQCIATKFPGGVAFRSCHIVAMPTYVPKIGSLMVRSPLTSGELIPKERMLPLKGVSTKQLQHKNRHRTSSVRAVSLSGSNSAEQSRRCIVLDIEGATTPISFVTDVLFPYARDNVRKHLMSTYDSDETKEDIKLLREQVEDDLKNGVVGSVPIPSDEAGKEEIIDSLVTNVQAMIKADRKLTSLKQLQGHIWRTGFENKELQGIVYEDVPEALQKWHAHGIKVYIYSSGSREAQRLIFGNTPYGDLRKYLCGFFDTTIGYKRESRSYFEISQSVGVDKPSQVLFVTDVYQEAVAAKAAGLEVLISIRPGNAPLPENHGFGTITSFAEIKPQ